MRYLTTLTPLAVAAVLAAATVTAAVPANAATPTGHKQITVSLRPSGKILVDWKATTGAKYYKVRTSSTPDMSDDIKTFKVAKSHTSKWIDLTADRYDYARPGSGNYVFVRVYAIKSDKVGVSPYKRVKLRPIAPPASAARATVATFNVRTAREDLPGHSWASRKDEVAERIREARPGIVAIQEAGAHGDSYDVDVYTGPDGERHKKRDYYWQFEQLRDEVGAPYALVDADEYGDGAEKEGTRILYDTRQFAVVDHGVLAAGSTAGYKRWVPWALLRNTSTGKQFYFFSAHLENRSDDGSSHRYHSVRKQQVMSIITKARQFRDTGRQVILAGDMNSNIYSEPSNVVDEKLLAAGFYDAYAALDVAYPYRHTFNFFEKKTKKSPGRTDYIFTFGGPKGSYAYKNWITKVDGVWPSDHNLQSASVPY